MSELVALPERALTLWQPWAWLLAQGHKNIENRPRGFSHKSFRGDFWIHAGAEPSQKTFDDQWIAAVGVCHSLRLNAVANAMTVALNTGRMAFGAIIGRATVTGIIPPRGCAVSAPQTDLGMVIHEPNVPWHFPDQYGFRVENAVALATPVPCRGYQGFWRVPAPVLEQLREAA